MKKYTRNPVQNKIMRHLLEFNGDDNEGVDKVDDVHSPWFFMHIHDAEDIFDLANYIAALRKTEEFITKVWLEDCPDSSKEEVDFYIKEAMNDWKPRKKNIEAHYLAHRITKEAWEELQKYKVAPNLAQLHFENNEFTYYPWRKTHLPISDEKAKELMQGAVLKSLNAYNKVVILSYEDLGLVEVMDAKNNLQMSQMIDKSSHRSLNIPELYWSHAMINKIY